MTKGSSNSFAQISKWKLPILVIGFVSVIALVFYLVYEGTEKHITIFQNGEQTKLDTHAGTVKAALLEKGIHVKTHDEVSPTKNTALKDDMKITYSDAKKLTIQDNDSKQTVWTTKDSVGDVLAEKSITLSSHDKISAANTAAVKDNMLIKIDRAVPLTLIIGSKKEKAWTTADNVSGFIQEKAMKLTKNDKISPAKATTIKENMQIKVTHFSKKTKEKLLTVAYKTIYKKDNKLAKGVEKVKTPGKTGKKRVKYKIILKDGKVHKRAILAEKIETKKRDKVVLRGTKTAPKLTKKKDTKSKITVKNVTSKSVAAPKSGKTITVTSTAYTGGGTTATGIHLQGSSKVIAVDPSVIPLGSKVWVEGYGEAIAGDTGGAIKGKKIDVYFSSSSACYSWGNRTVQIKILN